MTACARYWGSDGTLCAVHNGRFAAPSENRCDRAEVALSDKRLPSVDDLTVAILAESIAWPTGLGRPGGVPREELARRQAEIIDRVNRVALSTSETAR